MNSNVRPDHADHADCSRRVALPPCRAHVKDRHSAFSTLSLSLSLPSPALSRPPLPCAAAACAAACAGYGRAAVAHCWSSQGPGAATALLLNRPAKPQRARPRLATVTGAPLYGRLGPLPPQPRRCWLQPAGLRSQPATAEPADPCPALSGHAAGRCSRWPVPTAVASRCLSCVRFEEDEGHCAAIQEKQRV